VDAPLRSLLVIGEPVHAWMVAARLARALRRQDVRILVLEGDAPSAPEVLCLDPDIHAFHRSLGVEPGDLLRHLRAALRYGTEFSGWGAPGQAGFAAFGSAGQLIERVPFQHYVTALRALHGEARLADFAPATLAARTGRFGLAGSGPLAGLEAGLSVERADYLAFLRALATDLGAERVVGALARVDYDADGHAQALHLHDGRQLSADGYFDCSAEAALASTGVADTRCPFPAQVHAHRRERRHARLDVPTPAFDRVLWREDGWERIRCVGDILESERAWTGGAEAGGAQGLRLSPWQGRCVALGPALGEPEDLVADRWQLTRRAIGHWLRLLPTQSHCQALRDEFNRVVVAEARRLADAQSLPLLCASERQPGWATPVRVDAPAAADLRYRISLYRASGRLSFHEDDPIPAPRWMMLLEALGVLPRAADRMLPAIAPADLARRMDRVGQAVAGAVAGLPVHARVLEQLRQPGGAAT
jgi:tryptophan halogenase